MQARCDGPYAPYHLSQESCAIFETASVTAFPRMCAEKLMCEIAVAVFDVHKVEAQLPGHFGRTMEIFDDGVNLGVREQRMVVRKTQPPVQNGVVIQDARLAAGIRIGTAETPGVRQLQPDQQSVLGAGGPAVFFDQRRSQLSQTFLGVRSDHELIRIGASFVRDRDGLSTPNQLGAAAPKTLPAPERTLRGLAIERSVPAFHGLHGNPVADLDCAVSERPQERGTNAGGDLEVARDRQMERIQMLLEVCYILHAAQPQKRICAHSDCRPSGTRVHPNGCTHEIVVEGPPPKRDTHDAKPDRETGPGDLHAVEPAGCMLVRVRCGGVLRAGGFVTLRQLLSFTQSSSSSPFVFCPPFW